MKHTIEFTIGQSVWLRTDDNQFERIVTGCILRPKGLVIYLLTTPQGGETSHYSFEILTNPDYVRPIINSSYPN